MCRYGDFCSGEASGNELHPPIRDERKRKKRHVMIRQDLQCGMISFMMCRSCMMLSCRFEAVNPPQETQSGICLTMYHLPLAFNFLSRTK